MKSNNLPAEASWIHPVESHRRAAHAHENEGDIAPTWRALMAEGPTAAVPQTLSDLIRLYTASRHFGGLAETSKKSYQWLIERVDAKFGHLPIEEFSKRGARTVIRQWRDSLMTHPTSADRTMAVFRLILNFAVNEEYLLRNPLGGIGTVHKATRRDIIWSDEQVATYLALAPRHMSRAVLLALWTGQRQSDLLSLKWSDYDGKYIRLQQQKMGRGKVGRHVKVLVSRELREVLSEILAEQIHRSQLQGARRVERPETILTTSRGKPWKKGFKATWRRVIDSVGISGVTFHDLRGTFITLAHRSGSSIQEIALASGHDEKECESIIRRHYLSTGAEDVIARLESQKHFATDQWRLAEDKSHGQQSYRFTGPRFPRKRTKRGVAASRVKKIASDGLGP
jgi:integrase